MNLTNQFSEFTLIKNIAKRFSERQDQTIVGIGDDCAVIQLNSQNVQLITTDLLIENIHFDRHFISYRDIGYKAMIGNLSDIAAMGGIPRHYLASIAIPVSCTTNDVEAVYEGLTQPAEQSGTALIGGDTSRSPEKLFLSLTLIGEAKREEVIQRTGLCVGDEIFVTGTLGDSNAGLRILQSPTHTNLPASCQAWLSQRHLRPTARLETGQFLAKDQLATAMIDLSDGLSGDLAHLCELNDVGAIIDATRLPLSDALQTYARHVGEHAHEIALQGGEDYELLFTVKPNAFSRIAQLNAEGLLHVTHIGTITPKHHGLRMITPAGANKHINIQSYDHFQSQPVSATAASPLQRTQRRTTT